jgi:hypothetical protein
MTMKTITDLIPKIKSCLTNKNYRNILIGVILLIIVLICLRLFFFNDKEGFENQITIVITDQYGIIECIYYNLKKLMNKNLVFGI